ncbi:diphthine--ammonia ligase [Pedobacter sp. SD-b]|uniref:Diphthine--ammonia ligase n=1 Tax=Pedobacter segetis TaxID=2793069 RepID=A0ABS1BHQ6_9SPHI|nr:diphthine--ammonia ligase [Pedobacter segetis]MBK0382373.1 diphthine--ammonia ligase [Pedobacter segetis]
MNKISCIFNWSGGKDSSLALYHCLKNPQLDIKYLVTTINDSVNRISMHGVRYQLLLEQVKSIGIPLYEIRLPEMPTMSAYDSTMRSHLDKLKNEGITHSVFGDIFLEDLKKYREERLAEAGLKAIFPLWQRETSELIKEFIDLGFKTIIACTKENLGDFVGKVIDFELIKNLPKEVDVCGENGEFHTFAFEGPIFKKPISFTLGEKVFKAYKAPKSADDNCFQKEEDKPKNLGFWYIDLIEK